MTQPKPIKERPILFSAPMVRAILAAGKTQTRRVVKPQPIVGDRTLTMWKYIKLSESAFAAYGPFEMRKYCPDGKPGDRLWVRESGYIDKREKRFFAYAATMGIFKEATTGDMDETDEPISKSKLDADGFKSVPSIHMPRWASRITLEITGLRVERLNDISEADAIAEGLSCLSKDDGRTYKYGIPDADGLPGNDNTGWPWVEWDVSPIAAYRRLWEKINGPGSWDANPWVWIVEFRRVDAEAGR